MHLTSYHVDWFQFLKYTQTKKLFPAFEKELFSILKTINGYLQVLCNCLNSCTFLCCEA